MYFRFRRKCERQKAFLIESWFSLSSERAIQRDFPVLSLRNSFCTLLPDSFVVDSWSSNLPGKILLKFRGVILIFPFNQSRLPSTSRDVGKPLDHLIDVLEVSAHLTFHFAFFSGFWRHLLVLRWLKLIIFTLDETWITLFVPIWHS